MAAALRSRRPQIPCPVMLDQHHNAQLIVSLKCAPNSIPYSKLSLHNLSEAVKKILDSNLGSIYRHNAFKYGDYVNTESKRSLDTYCDIIESYANTTALGNFLKS